MKTLFAKIVFLYIFLSILFFLLSIRTAFSQEIIQEKLIEEDTCSMYEQSFFLFNNEIYILSYANIKNSLYDNRIFIYKYNNETNEAIKCFTYENPYIFNPNIFCYKSKPLLIYDYPKLKSISYYGNYKPWFLTLDSSFNLNESICDSAVQITPLETCGNFLINNDSLSYFFTRTDKGEAEYIKCVKFSDDLKTFDSTLIDTTYHNDLDVYRSNLITAQSNNDKIYLLKNIYVKYFVEKTYLIQFDSDFKKEWKVELFELLKGDAQSITFYELFFNNNKINLIYSKRLLINDSTSYSLVSCAEFDKHGNYITSIKFDSSTSYTRKYIKINQFNDNFYFIGKNLYLDNGFQSFFVEKRNKDLDTVWTMEFNSDGIEKSLSDIIQINDNSFLLYGTIDYKLYLAKLIDHTASVDEDIRANNNEIIVTYNPHLNSILLNIENSVEDLFEINIFNLYGQKILETKQRIFRNSTIELPDNIANGVYFINIKAGANTLSRKFLVSDF